MMKVDPAKVIAMSLPISDFVLMGEALSALPYRQVAETLQRMNTQLAEQVAEKPSAVSTQKTSRAGK
jgi:hypothetical protein